MHLITGRAESGAIILGRDGNYSRSFTSGRVLINHNKRWGYICQLDGFNNAAADVICHQLSYSGASSWSYAESDQ